jgi:hypothetical protein
VLLADEGVYGGECPREIYDSRFEGLCEEEAAVLMEVNVRRIEGSLPHPIPIQTSKPELSDSRSLKEADFSALISMNVNINESQKECLIVLLSSYMRCFTSRPGRCNIF